MDIRQFATFDGFDYVEGVRGDWRRQIAFVKDTDSVAPNYFDRIGTILVEWENKPFWWIGPDGRSKVLVWIPFWGYAMSHRYGRFSKELVDDMLYQLGALREIARATKRQPPRERATQSYGTLRVSRATERRGSPGSGAPPNGGPPCGQATWSATPWVWSLRVS